MPATRNIPSRRSRRLSNQAPPSYNEDGWEAYSFDDDESRGSPSPAMVLQYPSMSPVSPLNSEDESSEVNATHRSIQFPTRRQSHSRKRASDHIPRPPNAFMMFRSHYWATLKNNPNAENNHAKISQNAAFAWKALTAQEKNPFQQLAEAKKAEHALRYPGYKYSPNFSKNCVPKRKQPKKDEEERYSRVASYVRQGYVGDQLVNVMKDSKATVGLHEPSHSTIPATSEPASHIKAESPVMRSVPSLPELPPSQGEAFLPPATTCEAQSQPSFTLCPSTPDIPQPPLGFKPQLHPLAAQVTLSQLPEQALIPSSEPSLLNAPASLYRVADVETFFDYNALSADVVDCASSRKAGWSHNAAATHQYMEYHQYQLPDAVDAFTESAAPILWSPQGLNVVDIGDLAEPIYSDWLNEDPSLYES